MWAKFDCNGADAYASKTFTEPSEWWFEADVWIPSTTLTACEDGDLFGISADILSVLGSFTPNDPIVVEDASYPSGDWVWRNGFGTDSVISLTADASHTLKMHRNSTAVSWYVDGVLLVSYTKAFATSSIRIGGWNADDCSCEWYFVTNVKIGTTDGGTDIFADAFSSGDFSAWTSTSGSCSVVSAPSTCGGGATITATPASGCHGDTITVTGSGFAAGSPLTVTFGGVPVVFSEMSSDGSGDVSGTFVVPAGLAACRTCTYSIVVIDGSSNSASFKFTLCCPRSADNLDAITQLGPTPMPKGSGFTPLDYIHHDGAHYIAVDNSSGADPSIFTTFPPDLTYKAITVYRFPDDGSSVSSVDVQTGIHINFAKPGNAKTFITNCICPPDLCAACPHQPIWDVVTWYESWSRDVQEARFASDGTTLWLSVLSAETVPYPYLSNKDEVHCIDGQLSQFETLIVDGEIAIDYPDRADGLHKTIAQLIGSPDDFCYMCGYPTSDGGDAYSGYWSPPRVVMFSGDIDGFTRLDTMDAEFCPGITGGVQVPCGGSDPNTAPQGSFYSGVSIAASSAQSGVCHVVWSEGGDNGECGDGESCDACVNEVWDGGPPNRDYRIGYSVWGTSAKTSEVNLFTAHFDRNSNLSMIWPSTTDFGASETFQVRNDTGSPILFLSPAQTTADPDTGYHIPWYAEPTMNAYDLSGGSAVLLQSLDSALLPTLAEIERIALSGDAPNLLNAQFDVGFNPLAGLAVSNLYPDPLLSDEDVYLLGIDWTSGDAITATPQGPDCAAFYRIPADASATFDILDGIRAVGYSILVQGGTYFDPSDGVRSFVSDPGNLWSDASAFGGSPTGPWQLDRKCLTGWISYTGLMIGSGVDSLFSGFGWDGLNSLFAIGDFAGIPEFFALAKIDICRRCAPCGCSSSGLHIWQKI